MSAPIGPGDWVEAVIDWPYGPSTLVKGALYCVDAIYPEAPVCCLSCGKHGAGVGLVCDPTHGPHDCWCLCSFRPIYRPRSETFDHLLQPSPAAHEHA